MGDIIDLTGDSSDDGAEHNGTTNATWPDDPQGRYDHVKGAWKELRAKHGLANWCLAWNRRCKTRAGLTNYKTQTIELSTRYVQYADVGRHDVENTLLHEIAHALAGPTAGHGPVWKAKALSIGCDGERCHNKTFAQPRWIGKCSPTCEAHTQWKWHRLRRTKLRCTRCHTVIQISRNI
jgi:predicted SprT family Zn-dependent metalloprotease